MKKLILLIFLIGILISCKQQETEKRKFERGDLVTFNNQDAIITDFGDGTDWEITLLRKEDDYKAPWQDDIIYNVNESCLTSKCKTK